MSLASPSGKPGLGTVSAYQVSGHPWITATIIPANTGYIKVTFPFVTKAFTVYNINATDVFPTGSAVGTSPIAVFFGPEPTGTFPYPQIRDNHFVPLPSGTNSQTFNIKCKEVFICKLNPHTNIGAFRISAEETFISSYDMFALTGSGICENG